MDRLTAFARVVFCGGFVVFLLFLDFFSLGPSGFSDDDSASGFSGEVGRRRFRVFDPPDSSFVGGNASFTITFLRFDDVRSGMGVVLQLPAILDMRRLGLVERSRGPSCSLSRFLNVLGRVIFFVLFFFFSYYNLCFFKGQIVREKSRRKTNVLLPA